MSASTPPGYRGFGRRAPHARAQAWAAGAAPEHGGWLHLDVDATITIDHSDNKENAAATWKHTFGMHPLLVFLDRSAIAAGEALAGAAAAPARTGSAPSGRAARKIEVRTFRVSNSRNDQPSTGFNSGPSSILCSG
jgi:hypothetical protein